MKWLVVALCAIARAWAADPTCEAAANGAWSSLASTALTKDAKGAARQAFLLASAALPRCEQDETLWYVVVRSGELGFAVFPLQAGGDTIHDLDGALKAAQRRFPNSARLATINARRSGTVEAGTKAVVFDPAYSPAQVALASAQLSSGDARAALATLSALRDLDRVAGAYVLLGRARLAIGDAPGAIDAARREMSASPLNPWEPGAALTNSDRDAKELMGMAHLAAGKHPQAARELLSAAVDGSDSARRALERDPALRRACAVLSNDGRLPGPERVLAREVSGSAKL